MAADGKHFFFLLSQIISNFRLVRCQENDLLSPVIYTFTEILFLYVQILNAIFNECFTYCL